MAPSSSHVQIGTEFTHRLTAFGRRVLLAARFVVSRFRPTAAEQLAARQRLAVMRELIELRQLAAEEFHWLTARRMLRERGQGEAPDGRQAR